MQTRNVVLLLILFSSVLWLSCAAQEPPIPTHTSDSTLISTSATPDTPSHAAKTPSTSVCTSSPTPEAHQGTLLPTQKTVMPTLNPTQESQHEEIKQVITDYFEIRYQVLSTSPPDNFQEIGFGGVVAKGEEARDFLVTERAKLNVQKKYFEIKKYRYAEYEYSLEYKGISISPTGQSASVSLVKRLNVIRESSLENSPENPRVTGTLSCQHKIQLISKKGKWKIVNDTYEDSWWLEFKKSDPSTEEILRRINLKMQELEQMPSVTP